MLQVHQHSVTEISGRTKGMCCSLKLYHTWDNSNLKCSISQHFCLHILTCATMKIEGVFITNHAWNWKHITIFCTKMIFFFDQMLLNEWMNEWVVCENSISTTLRQRIIDNKLGYPFAKYDAHKLPEWYRNDEYDNFVNWWMGCYTWSIMLFDL